MLPSIPSCLLSWTQANYCRLSFVFRFTLSGQHNDARMNLAIALTAVRHGASVANHVEVLSLLKKKGTHFLQKVQSIACITKIQKLEVESKSNMRACEISQVENF